jgi:hypothetical protein
MKRQTARSPAHARLGTAAVLALTSALGFGAMITTPRLVEEEAGF